MAMRINALFTHTLRKAPPEARSAAHRLLVRGGYLRPVSPGHFATLPLGQRVLQRLHETLATLAGLAPSQRRKPDRRPPKVGRQPAKSAENLGDSNGASGKWGSGARLGLSAP